MCLLKPLVTTFQAVPPPLQKYSPPLFFFIQNIFFKSPLFEPLVAVKVIQFHKTLRYLFF